MARSTMSTFTLPAPIESAPVAPPAPAQPATSLAWLLAAALGALLVVHVPAFLSMPLDADVTEWDLCARTVLGGGAMYRDAVENNLPGMVWLHLLIRSLVGWRSEAIRAVDLVIVATIILLLLRWLLATCSTSTRLATAFVLSAFYLTTTEWCHC